MLLLPAAGCVRHVEVHSAEDLSGARIGVLTSMGHHEQLQAAFLAYKEGVDTQLAHNSFTDFLERFLNGLFYFEYNAIYITDVVNDRVFLSFISEGFAPVYDSFQGEDPEADITLNSFSPDKISGSFTVHVPAALSEEDIAVITNWVNYYRFAGTKFNIEVYE